MCSDGSRSSTAWPDGRQAPRLFSREKGEEELRPAWVHGHVAKSSPTQHIHSHYTRTVADLPWAPVHDAALRAR